MNKLTNNLCLNVIYSYDMVFLSEIKTNFKFNVPGYVSYLHPDTDNPTRGGIALLLKNYMVSDLKIINTVDKDVMWVEFKTYPNIIFGGIYIPPVDSKYASDSSFPILQSKILTNPDKLFLLQGDLNARIGVRSKSRLDNFASSSISDTSYILVDPILNSNHHGRKLLNFFENCNMLPLNGLQMSNVGYDNCLSFRRRYNWISTIDYVIASPKLIPYISSMNFHTNLQLPSNHAIIGCHIIIPIENRFSSQDIFDFQQSLLSYNFERSAHSILRKKFRTSNIDKNRFKSYLSNIIPALNANIDDDIYNLDMYVSNYTDSLHNACKNSIVPYTSENQNLINRWSYLAHTNDQQKIWRAINWNGQINSTNDTEPSEHQFAEYFGNLLNDNEAPEIDIDTSNLFDLPPHPVHDAPFTEPELKKVIYKVKDSVGPDGTPAMIFKYIPTLWFTFLLYIINLIFLSMRFPYSLRINRLVTIFKKGTRNLCSNYRDINISNSLVKIFDGLILNRLINWKSPNREQAGAQHSRGCLENIVALRLIFDMSVKKKQTLYVLFVDYSTAYAKIPRYRLLHYLKDICCPRLLLIAIAIMYKSTYIVIKSIQFLYNTGVRAGAPSSGYLFILYMDKFVNMLRDRCLPNGWLSWLHCLLLMDDKIIFSVDAEDFQQKCDILKEYCEESGMIINKDKTKIMIINNQNSYIDPSFKIGDWPIPICEKYCYLGMMFTSDGKRATSIEEQAIKKEKEVNKFIIFLKSNPEFPYFIKKKVLNAALFSSLLYGCECWLTEDLNKMNVLYLKAIRMLLDVRQSVPTDLILIEAGMQPLKYLVRERQKKFFNNVIQKRIGITKDPLDFIFNLVKVQAPSLVKHYHNNQIETESLEGIKTRIAHSDRSRDLAYLTLNQELRVSNIYLEHHVVPEYHRIIFTRLRLSSTYLKNETGRWKIPPVPVNERYCQCGFSNQNEIHIIQDCVISQHIRDLNSDIDFNISRFFNHDDPYTVCKLSYEIYQLYI